MPAASPWVFWGLVLLLFAYEFWALLDARPGNMISEIVWHLSGRPLVAFAFGMLMGHFFWQRG